MKIAIEYRNKINPTNTKLNEKDINYVRDKIMRKVKDELLLRIEKGYKNINLNLVEDIIEEFLKQTKIV